MVIDPKSADMLLRASRRHLEGLKAFKRLFNAQMAIRLTTATELATVTEAQESQNTLEMIVTSLETSRTMDPGIAFKKEVPSDSSPTQPA